MLYPAGRTLVLIAAVTAWVGVPVLSSANLQSTTSALLCPSGHSEAKLTGWSLNGQIPHGLAQYNETTKQLEVSVASMALPDGTTLQVFIGDDRVGNLTPLKGGSATGTINTPVSEGARVRVFNGDVPVVSANLQCVSATPTPTPTASPTPTPSPTATESPTPSPSPTMLPGPTASPTQDPMPMPPHSPAPPPTPDL